MVMKGLLKDGERQLRQQKGQVLMVIGQFI
jgi:hypothetical protein